MKAKSFLVLTILVITLIAGIYIGSATEDSNPDNKNVVFDKQEKVSEVKDDSTNSDLSTENKADPSIECVDCEHDSNGRLQEHPQTDSRDTTNRRASTDSAKQSAAEQVFEQMSNIGEMSKLFDDRLQNEPVEPEWSTQTENEIFELFNDSKWQAQLNESGLSLLESECRTTVCKVSFASTNYTGQGRMIKEMMQLTSIFRNNESLAEMQMQTEEKDGELYFYLYNGQ